MLISSCSHRTSERKLKYDIEIDYLSTPIDEFTPLPHDSVIICFVGNYDNDTITVSISNKIYDTSIRTTDVRHGSAGELILPEYINIKNIEIRINNGKIIYLEPESKHYNILLIKGLLAKLLIRF